MGTRGRVAVLFKEEGEGLSGGTPVGPGGSHTRAPSRILCSCSGRYTASEVTLQSLGGSALDNSHPKAVGHWRGLSFLLQIV